MEKFGKSQSVKRIEDVRLLTGKGRYVDDIAPSNALFVYVFRAPVSHAEIANLNVDQARKCDGVTAVITAGDLRTAGITLGLDATILTNRDGSKAAAPRRPLLAEKRVRFLGEPVAVVIAQSLNQARDAADGKGQHVSFHISAILCPLKVHMYFSTEGGWQPTYALRPAFWKWQDFRKS